MMHSVKVSSPPITVEELTGLLGSGEASSVELVEASFERIATLDDGFDGLRAVISLSPHAREAAREADARRREGALRSPLDGIPFLVKDCIETFDTATTHGSSLFRGWNSTQDAGSVRALRRAGAVMVGKASLDDFAAATVGVSSLRGTMPNPADMSRTVGGSSGGSASSVAAGYVPVAIGTDTGGSLRIPAAACGVTTIRPTPGTVPTDGIFPRSLGQDAVGPLAATVLGAAIAVDVMRGFRGVPDDRCLAPPAEQARQDPHRVLRGLTIGVVRGDLTVWGHMVDPDVTKLVEHAVDVLADAGARVVEASPPAPQLLDATALITYESAIAVDAYLAARPTAPVRTFVELVESKQYSAAAGVAFERELPENAGSRQSTRLGVMAQRAVLRQWTRGFWDSDGIDVVMYATTQHVAGPIGALPTGVYTRWAEHADLPALALPVGFVEVPGGALLPASAEFLARPFREDLLVRVAGALEALLVD